MAKRLSKKKRRKLILKVILIVIIIIIGFICYLFLNNKTFLSKVDYSLKGNITYYDIYGIHMNFEGEFQLSDNLTNPSLVLANASKEIPIKADINNKDDSYHFKTSEYINDGINLENLDVGTFYFLIKAYENDKVKYFPLINDTKYDDLTYYTLTKNNSHKKIDITWDRYQSNEILGFHIKNTHLPDEVYDITVDPGHDGNDAGMIVCENGDVPNNLGKCPNSKAYKESDINFRVSKALKEELEKLGFKVKLTRESENDTVPTYGDMGSGTTANKVKSKFNIALHHNSTNVPGGMASTHGLEVYVAGNSKFDLARLLVQNVCKYGKTSTSTKNEFKVEDGIYQRFSDDGITPYYYMIREVGGIATGAYVDGSNEKYDKNPYYNSNNTAEGYLLELGYIDNVKELHNILDNPKGYAKGIALAIVEYLK